MSQLADIQSLFMFDKLPILHSAVCQTSVALPCVFTAVTVSQLIFNLLFEAVLYNILPSKS